MLVRCLSLLLVASLAVQVTAGEAIDLPALLGRLPASERAEAEKVSKELVKGGKAAVAALVDRLEGKEGVKARYALHGLAIYTARAGAGDERKTFSAALATHLDGKHSPSVRGFVLEQLQYCGGPGVVPPVAALLGDKALGGQAAQTLTRIGGAEAKKALRDALGDDKVAPRADVVLALGHLRDKEAAGVVLKVAASMEPVVRLAALTALGQIGDAKAAPVLLAAVGDKATFERARVLDACLGLAERLHAEKQTAEARKFLEALLDKVKDERGRFPLIRLRVRLDGGK